MSASNYQDDLAADVLSQFACPGICDGSYSSWKGSAILEDTFRCPFVHPQSNAYYNDGLVHERNPSTLRKIPPYVCVEHLMRMCRRDTKGHNLVNHPPLVKCSAGFHHSVGDLIDLEQLPMRAYSILANLMDNAGSLTGNPGISQQATTSRGVQSPGNKQTREPEASTENASSVSKPECAICFEEIVATRTPFGLLAECPHHFCAPCIINWFQRADSNKSCPICRTVSESIIISARMLKTKKCKREVARLQRLAVNVTQPNGHRQ